MSHNCFSVFVCKAVYIIPLNRHCTYQAELSEGSDQEKAAYIINTKQKVVKLIGQWVALFGLLLKEDPIASDFLEVGMQALFNYMLMSQCPSVGIFPNHFKNIDFVYEGGQ